jgi:hypothetical protein
MSFFWDVQVISPELTFYDSSKLSMDDSLHIEKLLRAKMDFSFMFVFSLDLLNHKMPRTTSVFFLCVILCPLFLY